MEIAVIRSALLIRLRVLDLDKKPVRVLAQCLDGCCFDSVIHESLLPDRCEEVVGKDSGLGSLFRAAIRTVHRAAIE